MRGQAVVKLAENFNGADLRNVCTEAGMFAIRDERDYVVHEVRIGAFSSSCGRALYDYGNSAILHMSVWKLTLASCRIEKL